VLARPVAALVLHMALQSGVATPSSLGQLPLCFSVLASWAVQVGGSYSTSDFGTSSSPELSSSGGGGSSNGSSSGSSNGSSNGSSCHTTFEAPTSFSGYSLGINDTQYGADIHAQYGAHLILGSWR
jgi:hypothetical protein